MPFLDKLYGIQLFQRHGQWHLLWSEPWNLFKTDTCIIQNETWMPRVSWVLKLEIWINCSCACDLFFLSCSNEICELQPALVFKNNLPLAVYTWPEYGLRPRLGVKFKEKRTKINYKGTQHIHTLVFCTYSTRKTSHIKKDHSCSYAYITH